MSKRYQVTLTLEGLHAKDGHADLDTFVFAVRDFRDALRAIERELYDGSKPALEFRVVDLRHTSPATVTIEAFARPGRPDLRDRWMARVNDTLQSVPHPEASEALSFKVLGEVKQLSGKVGSKLAALRIETPQSRLVLDREIHSKVADLVTAFREYRTEQKGTLDTIDFHAGTNRFVIYPANGLPARVQCVFPERMADEAAKAIRQPVIVSGLGRFRHKTYFPTAINVEALTVLPSDADLPTLQSLRGIENNIPDGSSSEKLIAEIRDGWS